MAILTLLIVCGLSLAFDSTNAASCRQIRQQNPNAPSGVYEQTHCVTGAKYQIYCEMGLGGGNYTFLSPQALTVLTDADLQSMFIDRTSFLMRLRRCDGSQTYSVLKQLPQYSSTPLFLGLNRNAGYSNPVNGAVIGAPYLYYGFLPIHAASNNNVQGLTANGKSLTFSNCDKNPNSHLTLFPNFRETVPSAYGTGSNWALCDNLLVGNPVRNPSTRVMPPEWFMFLETHWGGCGCYTQTDARLVSKCILGANIGFR